MYLAAQNCMAQTFRVALAYIVQFAQLIRCFNSLQKGVFTLLGQLTF